MFYLELHNKGCIIQFTEKIEMFFLGMEDLVKENMVLEEELNALESDSVRENKHRSLILLENLVIT